MDYNELVQKRQEGVIDDLEFLLAQKDLAEIYDYKGQKLEADILICTPFTGHPMKGIYIILYSF